MPLFSYKAVDRDGEIVEGQLEAPNQSQLIARLRASGHFPIRAEPAGAAERPSVERRSLAIGPRGETISTRDIAGLTAQLATMLSAGLDLNAALGVLAEVSEKDEARRLVHDVRSRVQHGASLSDALEPHTAFSPLYVNMVRAGESVGKPDLVLERLADYLERVLRLRETVTNALIYPSILLLAAGASLLILLVFVLPRFKEMFDSLGAPLPLATQMVIAAGDMISSLWWLVLLLVVAGIYWFRTRLQTPAFRRAWDERLLKLPVFGRLLTALQVARFTRTLGTLTHNGVPLISSLSIVRAIVTNQAIAVALAGVTERVKHGQGLAGPLAETGYFPRQAIQMIRVGEETGHVDEMLLKLGDIYDKEVEVAVSRLLSLLEPALIIGFGLLIAFIIMSLLTAILGINELPF
jgi:general secretion pathway protein F